MPPRKLLVKDQFTYQSNVYEVTVWKYGEYSGKPACYTGAIRPKTASESPDGIQDRVSKTVKLQEETETTGVFESVEPEMEPPEMVAWLIDELKARWEDYNPKTLEDLGIEYP